MILQDNTACDPECDVMLMCHMSQRVKLQNKGNQHDKSYKCFSLFFIAFEHQ